MSALSSLFYLLVFVVGLLFLLLGSKGFLTFSFARKIRSAQQPSWDLNEFLKLQSVPSDGKSYLFQEQSVYSMTYRYTGRFDGAVLQYRNNVPILDVVIERKFPRSILPDRAHPEDFFQAGLYALALRDRGVSCTSTKLIVIYCLQEEARQCTESSKSCFDCTSGRIYTKKFKVKTVIKRIRKLDEIWYRDRKPKATPSERKCIRCPYSRDGRCNYSIL